METEKLTSGQRALLNIAPTSSDSSAPAAASAPATPVNVFDVSKLTDAQITDLLAKLQDEQHERALASADVEALTTEAFSTMFTSRGVAQEPQIMSGLLVCAGSLRNVSATSHECSFTHIGDYWCWEHPDQLNDEVRRIPEGGRDHLKTVTIMPALEGMELTFVSAKSSMREGHKAKKSVTYKIVRGELEVINSRNVTPVHSGR